MFCRNRDRGGRGTTVDWMRQPWAWYVAGPLIGLMAPALLLLAGKTFGVSSSFRHLCSACLPKTKLAYLRENDWRTERWNLVFVGGILLGGVIANRLLTNPATAFLPDEYHTAAGALKLFLGGILVGFGTRWADGCTSGHTIMGLSNLRWPSLVATICFFIGGLVMTGLMILF